MPSPTVHIHWSWWVCFLAIYNSYNRRVAGIRKAPIELGYVDTAYSGKLRSTPCLMLSRYIAKPAYGKAPYCLHSLNISKTSISENFQSLTSRYNFDESFKPESMGLDYCSNSILINTGFLTGFLSWEFINNPGPCFCWWPQKEL